MTVKAKIGVLVMALLEAHNNTAARRDRGRPGDRRHLRPVG